MQEFKKYLFLLLLPLCFLSCEREFEFQSNSNGFTFSVDTLMFDTIFSTIGSVTKNFKVYNPYDEDLIINLINLAGGDESQFRLNINGIANNSAENIKINALDSLYIFVDLTIDELNSNTPLIVDDSVIVIAGEKTQKIDLIAYGQDVVKLTKENLKTTTFTSDKPYLIYDFIVVDSLETLTIEAGARLHFHNDARLVVFGSMVVNGTTEEPVQFLGHRLEDWYQDKPGQWGHIHFMPGSSNNSINNAIIRNSMMGFFVDSVGLESDPPLIIDNTFINHTSQFGILSQNSKIDVSNTVVGDCGIHSVALTLGGTYNFYHCTFANYFGYGRSTPALFLNNYYTDNNGKEVINPLIEANFYNSIVYGRNYTELGFDFKDSDKTLNADYNYKFEDCLVRSGNIDISDPEKFIRIIANEDPNFIDPYESNFQLDTLSVCKDVANENISINFPFDILGNSRLENLPESGPDLGAYERIEKE
ncbi:hypothetical protein E9993_22210 [Labilibacter sediminis]|nr:hypothetical protein E9993_22210 [Labilibacter sediminis]